MTNTILQLPYGLPTMNDIIKASKQVRRDKGRYYSAYMTLKKKYTTLIAEELVTQSCVPDVPYDAVRIDSIWIESAKKRDPDNVRAGVKFLLDAMVQVGIIADDDRDHVVGFNDSFPVSNARKVSTQIIEVDAP
jgi:Holliday junction resolvase RusA-like endonuclease